jgi:outer membrane protein assembly factor BamE
MAFRTVLEEVQDLQPRHRHLEAGALQFAGIAHRVNYNARFASSSVSMRIAAPFFAVLLALSTSACIYRLDVQQGNLVTQESVSKLKKGMTKSEVRQLLGTPLLMDPFHGNRWDYYFSTEVRGRLTERNRFSVYFENDKLTSVTGDIKPAAPTAAAATPATAAPATAAPATAAPATAAPATTAPTAPATPVPATNPVTK